MKHKIIALFFSFELPINSDKCSLGLCPINFGSMKLGFVIFGMIVISYDLVEKKSKIGYCFGNQVALMANHAFSSPTIFGVTHIFPKRIFMQWLIISVK